ncbi:MAG: SdrD B-like domain-containing protein [Chthoniobacterales bacterium]
MDTHGILWVGMWYGKAYYKVDPVTGNVIGAPIPTGTHQPYGCQVDSSGTLWSIDGDGELLEINTATSVIASHVHTNLGMNYSLSLFDGCGSAPNKVYLSSRGRPSPTPTVSPKTYIAYDQQNSFTVPPLAPTEQFESNSVGVDSWGNIFSGYSERNLGGRIIKTDPTGNVLWDTDVPSAGPTVHMVDLHGLIVDKHDDVWAVDLTGNQVVKYAGGNGHYIATTPVGFSPYTYSNPPPPTCPCVQITDRKIACEQNENGTTTYSWSFTFVNHSPFPTPATSISMSSNQATNITPSQVVFAQPVLQNGQETVSGTFQVANPVVGSMVCLDVKLSAAEEWCCRTERVCFSIPDCAKCAQLEGHFICDRGHHILQLAVTNQGPTAAAAVQVFSNTPGVTVTPPMTMQNFPKNTAVTIPLTLIGASPGQAINLIVNMHGPISPETGVYSWCCSSNVRVTNPSFVCPWWIGGDLFQDANGNGVRDSGDNELAGWTVTLTPEKGKTHTTTSDAAGAYHFDDIEPGKCRVSVQPPKTWRATFPKTGAYLLSVEAPPQGKLNFGFAKTQR